MFHCMGVCHSLSIHSPVEEHLDCFQFLEIMDKVCINIGMQVSVCK